MGGKLDDEARSESGDPVQQVQAALVRLRRAGAWKRREQLLPGPLTQVEFPVLQVIDVVSEGPDAGQPGVSVGTVANRLGVDPSRASRVVARAVDAGFVERIPSSLDARRMDLRLTRSGRAMGRRLSQYRRSECEQILQGWPEADRRRFAALFMAFAEGFTTE